MMLEAESGTVIVGVLPLFVMVRVAARAPVACGVKVMPSAHELAVRIAEQEFEERVKSATFVPDRTILAMEMG